MPEWTASSGYLGYGGGGTDGPIEQATDFAGDVINHPAFRWLMSNLSSAQQANAQNEANFMTDQQIEDALQLSGDIWRDQSGIYNQGANAQLDLMGDVRGDVMQQAYQMPGRYNANRMQFLGDLQGRNQGINQGYGDRYRFAQDQIEDFGRSGATAIDRAFDIESGAMQQNMLDRGLSTSQGAMDESALITERRADAHQRLQDDLMRNRVNILSDLSGQGLAADERMSNVESAFDAAMRGDVMSAQENMMNRNIATGFPLANQIGANALTAADLYGRGGYGQLGVLQSINNIPPPPNQAPWQLGQGAVDPPSAPGQSAVGQAGDIASIVASLASIISDRNVKHSVRSVDDAETLSQFDSMPVHSWKYNGSDEPHIGPMAQDFKASFGLGNGRTIPVVDAFGVLASAVRALSKELRELKAKVA